MFLAIFLGEIRRLLPVEAVNDYSTLTLCRALLVAVSLTSALSAVLMFGYWLLQAPCVSAEECMHPLNAVSVVVQLASGVAMVVAVLVVATVTSTMETPSATIYHRSDVGLSLLLQVYFLHAVITALTAVQSILSDPFAALLLYSIFGRVVALALVYNTCRVTPLPESVDEGEEQDVEDGIRDGGVVMHTAPAATSSETILIEEEREEQNSSSTVTLQNVYPNQAALMQYVVQFDNRTYTIRMRHLHAARQQEQRRRMENLV